MMTDYELLDAAGTFFGLGTDCVTNYLTVLAAYLVAAYLLGPTMSRVQVAMITSLYVVAQLFITWGAAVYYKSAMDFVQGVDGTTAIGPHVVAAPLLLGGLLAGLVFMWQVRHPKSE